MPQLNQNILLRAVKISKRYPGVKALDDVDLEIRKGEIHALVGENGAGKSTFVNVIGGVVKPDSGSILFEGKNVQINDPKQAYETGIAVVHQELSLFPNLGVATNLYLSNLEEQGSLFVPDKKMEADAREILRRVGLEYIHARTKVSVLQPGEQQLVEIARAIVKDAKLIVLDEPTSSLADREIRVLFQIVRELKKEGVSIIFVSHRLDEVFQLCDRVSVLRDGKHIKTINTASIDKSELISLILGRKLSEMYSQAEPHQKSEELLRVENLWEASKLRGVSFSLYKGEILGIAGLLGSGRSELVRTIFGLKKRDRGEIFLRGKTIQVRSPEDVIRRGIGYITEDRHKEGLVLEKSIMDNVVMANLKMFANRWGLMKPSLERQAALHQKENLNIVTPSIRRRVKFLSGGNQQKVVLSKWLEIAPEIYILDEPTRGIDVGAKAEFFKIIKSLAGEGAGVLFISSELQEIVSICHRVLVLHNGKFVAEFSSDQINPAAILMKMTGESNGRKGLDG